MTIEQVLVGRAASASKTNQLIEYVNRSGQRVVFTASGTWSVPNGVHCFRVYICGGGGGPGADYVQSNEGGTTVFPGGAGGISPLVDVVVNTAEIGSSFVVTIGSKGATGVAGTGSAFGTLITVAGGGAGENATGNAGIQPGSLGAVGGSLAAGALRHFNGLYMTPAGLAYGQDTGGIVVIEW